MPQSDTTIHPFSGWDIRLARPLFSSVGLIALTLLLVPVEMLRNGFLVHGVNDSSRILMDFFYANGQFQGTGDMMLLSEIFKKTLFYPILSWLFLLTDHVTASYIGFSVCYFLYVSGFVWLLRQESRSFLALVALLTLLGSPSLFGFYNLFPPYLSHHLMSYAWLIWAWFALLNRHPVLTGLLYSLALGVHVPSALPSGLCFFLLLAWEPGDWRTRITRMGVVLLAATPVTLYFISRMLGGAEDVNLWSQYPDAMRLVRFRAPFFLTSGWSPEEWLHLFMWLVLVPGVIFRLRDHLSQRLALVARAIRWVGLPYVVVTQGLLELTHAPFFVLLTGKGLEVLIPLQFLLLLTALKRCGVTTGQPGLFLFLATACVAALTQNALFVFCGLLLSLLVWTSFFPTCAPGWPLRSWVAGTVMLLFLWCGAFLSHWMQTHPRLSMVELVKLIGWSALESPRLQGVLMGKRWFPGNMQLSHYPPERQEAIDFLRGLEGDDNGLIAIGWRDNWWSMGLQAFTRRGFFVDWDSAGDGTRAASGRWLREWFGRYGANQIFFSFPDNGITTPEYRRWSYSGPGRERRIGALAWYMRRADDDAFRKAAQFLYERNVRWVLHLGPFPRPTDLLQPVFAKGDLLIFRLSDPGVQEGMAEFAALAAREPLPNEQPEAPTNEWH
ncbi:MAG: hypothetical protein HQM02_02640 [Magnetococcales bacterium]|nr:hypothetical protein [Magnetococcales bacterium]